MAGPTQVLDKGFTAGEAINQYHFVKEVAGEVLNECDTQGELALGVAQEEISAGDATNSRVANVRLLGISRVIAGAAISIFTEVTVGADARAEAATTGDRVAGIALQAAAADGDHIDVLLTPAGPTAA